MRTEIPLAFEPLPRVGEVEPQVAQHPSLGRSEVDVFCILHPVQGKVEPRVEPSTSQGTPSKNLGADRCSEP